MRQELELDTSGLSCPYPLAKAKKMLKKMLIGERLKIISTDSASEIDFKVFTEMSAEFILEKYEKYSVNNQTYYVFFIKKIK